MMIEYAVVPTPDDRHAEIVKLGRTLYRRYGKRCTSIGRGVIGWLLEDDNSAEPMLFEIEQARELCQRLNASKM
jgi:hypothetical protein